MFKEANKKIRNSIYGVLCQSQLGGNQVNLGNGTAFMIAPGILGHRSPCIACGRRPHETTSCQDRSNPLSRYWKTNE